MYKTKIILNNGGHVLQTLYAYEEWLKGWQEVEKIEITAVTAIEKDLIVTYRCIEPKMLEG